MMMDKHRKIWPLISALSLVAALAGCGPGGNPSSDAGTDGAGGADLATPQDLASLPDQATPPDLTSLPDQATPPDLTSLPDQATPPDLTSLPDQATPPDLTSLPDQATPLDLLSVPDLANAGPVSIQGAIQKGPFGLGSNVTVATLNPQTTDPTGQTFPTTTRNELGEFNLTLPSPGAIEIQTTGFYFNEVLNSVSTAQITMRALAQFTTGGPQQVYVNAMTHLTQLRVRYLVRNGTASFADAITQAESELRAALPLATGTSVGAGTGLNVLGGDSEANAYLLALSCVLAQTALTQGGSSVDAALQDLMSRIALDLETDGRLDATRSNQLADGARFLDAGRCAANIAGYAASRGSSATPPDIYRAIDFDRDGIADATDGDADGDGVLAAQDTIVAIAGSEAVFSTLAIDAGGAVWFAGQRQFSSPVGCPPTGISCPPLPIPNLTGIIEGIVVRDNEAAAGRRQDGRVVYFDGFGAAPAVVAGIDNVVSFGRTDLGYIYAIRNDGTVWRIRATPGSAPTATQIPQVSNVRAFVENRNGGQYFWVLRASGVVTGYRSDFAASYALSGLPAAVEIAVDTSADRGFAVDGSGQLWRWSPIQAVQTGSAAAQQVTTSFPVEALSTEARFAVLADGSVWRLDGGAPVMVAGIGNVQRVAGELALLRDGTVVTFQPSGGTTVTPAPLRIPR
jgi:hypothetical protein